MDFKRFWNIIGNLENNVCNHECVYVYERHGRFCLVTLSLSLCTNRSRVSNYLLEYREAAATHSWAPSIKEPVFKH